MPAIASFQVSPARRDQLGGMIADYLALERARCQRRVLVTVFGLLAMLMLAVGAALQRDGAAWIAVVLCLAVPAWAWTIELKRDSRLARRLNDIAHA